MTKRRQSITALPEPNTEANRKRRRSLVAATNKRRKKKSKTSMNLWIILALTWISITVVIADHGWFVQDSPPAGEEDELFSSEQLLLVKPKAKPKPKSVTPVKVSTDHHAKDNPKKKVVQMKQKNQSKSDKKSAVNDVVSEQFIPVQKTGRKPLAVQEKPTETKKTPVKVTTPEKKSPVSSTGSSKTTNQAWFIQDDSLNEDENDLFSSENLLVVKPKKKYKPKPVKPTKPVVKAEKPSEINKAEQQKKKVENKEKSPSKPTKTTDVDDVESEHLIPVHGAVRKPLAVAQNLVEKVKPVKKPAAPVKEVEEFDEVPCDNERNIDCLMETEELILVDKKKQAKPAHKVDTKPLIKRENVETKKEEVAKKTEPKPKKVEEVQRAALHRRLLDSDKSSTTQPSKAVQQPLLYEINEEDEFDDLLATERKDDEILRRLRRQATNDETDGSGDQTASFQSETAATSNPTYNLRFSTTLNTSTSTPLNEALRQQYAEDLVRQLNATYYNYPGFVGIAVRNVSLDENGRVVIDWDLVLSQSGAPGTTPEERTQSLLGFLNDTVIPSVNDLEVLGDPVYTPLDRDVTMAIAESALTDVCQAANSCLNGYVCIRRGTLSLCQHKCYSTGLIDQCQNGGSCQLDAAYEPYCQCGTGFTGDLCQNATTGANSTTYSTTQVVGAGVAGAVAATGAIAALVYLFAFWRRGEQDMEYSYFGDDDNSRTAYNDADANLGASSYTIPRATIDFTAANVHNGANV